MKKTLILLTLLAILTLLSNAQTVTDIDNNVYNTVTIGTQTWMAENLRVTKYNDGNAIPLFRDSVAWASSKPAGYCWYNNDAAANKNTNGGLYNWYAVNTGKLAPAGWHVPTNVEWQALISFMQAKDIADKRYSLNIATLGDIAKAMSLATGWTRSSVAGSPGNTDFPDYVNKSGFSALPSGTRCYPGGLGYSDINYNAFWWTSVDCGVGAYVENLAWGYYVSYNKTTSLPITVNKFWGISVRCIKDAPSGINNIQPNAGIKIFPNPAIDKVTISLSDATFLGNSVFTICNLQGQIIIQQALDSKITELNVITLPKGVYLMKVSNQGKISVTKFVK